eukprot:15462357-Alexandrium_andersonii.AAC.1
MLGPLGNSRIASSSDVVGKLSGSSGLPGGGPGLTVQEGDGAVLLPRSAELLAPGLGGFGPGEPDLSTSSELAGVLRIGAVNLSSLGKSGFHGISPQSPESIGVALLGSLLELTMHVTEAC